MHVGDVDRAEKVADIFLQRTREVHVEACRSIVNNRVGPVNHGGPARERLERDLRKYVRVVEGGVPKRGGVFAVRERD